MIHEELDEYWSNILSNYSSKQRSENEIITTFELGGKKVVSSVCYSESSETKKLAYFSLDIKISDNIKDFFEAIGETKYFKIVQDLNVFYDLANTPINGLSITFSCNFELASIMLIDEFYDRSKRIFKTDVENILINDILNEQDLINFMIADYIISDDDLINDLIDVALPNYDDSPDKIIVFLEEFKKYNIKSLYISKQKSKKKAIEQFTVALKDNGIDYTIETSDNDNFLIKCNTSSFVYNFEIYSAYNDTKDGFDITFKLQYQYFQHLNPFSYLLNITKNGHLYIPFKQLVNKTNELKIPITTVTILINPDLSFNRIFLNNFIIYNYHVLNNTGYNEDVLLIKYLYAYYKDIIDSQNLEFFNSTILSNDQTHWPHVIDDYYKYKDDLFTIIKMSTI